MIRGFHVPAIEACLTVLAFTTAATAGLLRVVEGRMLKPSSGLEVGIIGVVAFIAGSAISRGVLGVAIAGLLIVVVRLALQLLSEGDWSRAAPLLVLTIVLLARRGDSTLFRLGA